MNLLLTNYLFSLNKVFVKKHDLKIKTIYFSYLKDLKH